MKTSEAQKRATIKYARENLKRVPFDVQKEYYDSVLKPHADSMGMTVNGFIKQAIAEKIERDQKTE